MEQGLRAIYDSFGIKDGIEGHIFRETLRLLNEAAAEGVRAESPQMTSYQELLLQEFRSSNEVFSAFRTHRMQNDVARQLLGKDGKRKSFDQWKRDVKGMTDHYFGPWLRTEYNTAVIRAQNAARWKRFEQDAGIMPNLTWMPTTSATPDLAHERYWAMKLTLPVNHPFWERERPGNRWNCKCSLEQTDDVPVTTDAEFGALPKKPTAQKGLDNNPADGRIFSDTHPYFPKNCSSCPFKGYLRPANKILSLFNRRKDCYDCFEEAERKRESEIQREARKRIEPALREKLVGKLTFRDSHFGGREAVFVRNSISENLRYGELFDVKVEILNHVGDYLRRGNLEYEWADNVKTDKKPYVKGYHNFKTPYNGLIPDFFGRNVVFEFEERMDTGLIKFHFIKIE